MRLRKANASQDVGVCGTFASASPTPATHIRELGGTPVVQERYAVRQNSSPNPFHHFDWSIMRGRNEILEFTRYDRGNATVETLSGIRLPGEIPCRKLGQSFPFGVKGGTYDDFSHDDAVGEAFMALDELNILDRSTTETIEAAFHEGLCAFRLVSGWPTTWTTASESYDYSGLGTTTLESCEWKGKTLRKVIMHPTHAAYQCGRYSSGINFVGDEDPRIVDARIQAQIDRENAEREASAQRRIAGLGWLKTADIEPSSCPNLEGVLYQKGLTWRDRDLEETRRHDEKEAAERGTLWGKCRAAFVDGVTMVDPGRDAQRGIGGIIPGTDCAIYRNVVVVPHWQARDADETIVEDERHTVVGSLHRVAERLQKGELRLARPDEMLPPASVMDRLKPSRLESIKRFEIDDHIVWVGRQSFSLDISVLNDKGHIVRKQSIVQAARAALLKSEGW